MEESNTPDAGSRVGPLAEGRIEPPGDEDDCYALRQVAPARLPEPSAPPLAGVAPPEPSATGLASATPSAAAPEEPDRDKAAERAARREEQEELAWEAVASTPPGPMLCSGTFGFPFRLASLPPLVMLTAVDTLAIGALWLGNWSAASGAKLPGPVAAGAVGAGAALIAIGGVIGAACLAAVAIYGVTILRETAAGAEIIEDWPNLIGVESASGIAYAAAALALAAVPGALAAAVGIPRTVVFPLSIVVLFAPFLLSALEAHSPLYVVSPAAWRAVTHAWRAWCLFYLLVSALAIAIALIVLLSGLFGAVISAIVAGFLLAAGSMIYFRLLGRLAWFCSGRWAWEDDSRRMGEEEDS